MDPTRLIIDSDTATDDALAILLCALSERVTLEGVTIVAGNVDFDSQVENAKYTLELAGVAERVPVYEGAREPLERPHETATEVHGEGGLGGELFPDTGIDSAEEDAVDYILDTVQNEPAEFSLLCIGPLTNIAMALEREPELGESLDSVWVMGGAANTLGNVTPAAEYNFWADPEAAAQVLESLEVTMIDWGLSTRDGVLDDRALERLGQASDDSRFAEFFETISSSVREFTSATQGIDGVVQADGLAAALAIDPTLATLAGSYYVDVDDRDGLTRGYSLVDEDGVTDTDPQTRVVESVDTARFQAMVEGALLEGDPEARSNYSDVS